MIFCDKNYTSLGAILHQGKTALRDRYIAVVRKKEKNIKNGLKQMMIEFLIVWPRNSKDIYFIF